MLSKQTSVRYERTSERRSVWSSAPHADFLRVLSHTISAVKAKRMEDGNQRYSEHKAKKTRAANMRDNQTQKARTEGQPKPVPLPAVQITTRGVNSQKSMSM